MGISLDIVNLSGNDPCEMIYRQEMFEVPINLIYN